MSHLSLPKLAAQTGFTRRHLQRMAADGLIPGATRTAGGHWQIKEGPVLSGWIAQSQAARSVKTWAVRDKWAPLHRAVNNLKARTDTAMAEWIASGNPRPPAELVRLVVKAHDLTTANLEFVSKAIRG